MYWFLPLRRGQPSWKATFLVQNGWPHKRGSTVYGLMGQIEKSVSGRAKSDDQMWFWRIRWNQLESDMTDAIRWIAFDYLFLSLIHAYLTEYDLISELTLCLSRWQVSRVKQGTLTLPEHLVPHPLQGALNCIGCSLAWYLYFTHVVYSLIYGIDYQYWICMMVL